MNACPLPTETERAQAAEIARLFREAPLIADRMLAAFLTLDQPQIRFARRYRALMIEAERREGLH